MMSSWKIYIGKQRYKIYLGAQPYNIYINGVSTDTDTPVVQLTTSVRLNIPTAPDAGWFTTDTEEFISRFSWYAYVNDDPTQIVAYQGDTTRGWLEWSTDERQTWSTDFKLLHGTNNYWWRFAPSNTADLTSAQGYFTLTVRVYDLYQLRVAFDGGSEIFKDYKGWNAIRQRFLYEALFLTNYDSQGNPQLTSQRVSYDDPALTVVLVDVDTGERDEELRPGTFYLEFTYTYKGVTVTHLTEASYPIMSKTVSALYAQWKGGSQPVVYDSMTSLDILRNSLEVWDNDLDPVDDFIFSVSGWEYIASVDRYGVKAGIHVLTISYGTASPATLNLLVEENVPDSLTVTWEQISYPTIGTPVTDIVNYGTLTVWVNYRDGARKQIELQTDNKEGYTISGSLTRLSPDTNTVRITYTEENPVSGGSTTVRQNIFVTAVAAEITE